MVSKSSKSGSGATASGSSGERAEQLARALRDNLRRRKSQARARQDRPEDSDAAAEKPGDPAKV